VGKQAVRQAARRAASQVQARYRRERVERDRRLERLAVEVLTALGERDAMIAATEQRAGAALQAMIIDEHLTVSEATLGDTIGKVSSIDAIGSWRAGVQQPAE
jgi:hypothetical protein